MSSLRTLHEAFEELEHRADAAPAPESSVATPTSRRRWSRLLAPGAAAAAVLAAASITVWQQSGTDAPAQRQSAAASVTSAPSSTPSALGP